MYAISSVKSMLLKCNYTLLKPLNFITPTLLHTSTYLNNRSTLFVRTVQRQYNTMTIAYTDDYLQHSIGTHNGTFHCDEALACHMLTQHTAQYHNYNIVRTRDPTLLDKLPIVVDVGAVYNDSTKRYDHHQRGFEHTFDKVHNTKLSSAGLIYKHYGKSIIQSIIQQYIKQNNKDSIVSDSDIELIWQQTYNNFIEAIDGIDNGVQQYDGTIQAKYKSNTDLSSRVAMLNPSWNELTNDTIQDTQFKVAMTLTGTELTQSVLYCYNSWLPARTIVLQAFNNRLKYHSSGEILVLEQYTIWKSHIFDIEQEHNAVGTIKYIIYGDSSGSYRIQAMPLNEHGFENRLSLPEQWRGLRDNELSQCTGIADCIFVHATGFIGGNKTKNGVIQMAVKALELAKQDGSSNDKKPRIE